MWYQINNFIEVINPPLLTWQMWVVNKFGDFEYGDVKSEI